MNTQPDSVEILISHNKGLSNESNLTVKVYEKRVVMTYTDTPKSPRRTINMAREHFEDFIEIIKNFGC